jgi:hypothetical protein
VRGRTIVHYKVEVRGFSIDEFSCRDFFNGASADVTAERWKKKKRDV